MNYLPLLLIAILAIGCTPTTQHTRVKREQCRRDKTLFCSKSGAPVLEQMSQKELAASISQFGASFKNKGKVVFKDTRISEIDQCISVFQYYNCKTYCESDTMTKQEKIAIDLNIIKDCKGMIPANATAQKSALLKKLKPLSDKRRIWIRFKPEGLIVTPTLRKLIYLAFEEKATTAKYQIIDDAMKKKAYLQIKRQRGFAQNDPRFLPEFRKQLAANVMVEVDITPLGRFHLFSIRFTEMETAATLMTKTIKYNEQSDPDREVIYDDFQNLAGSLFKNLDPNYTAPPNAKPLLSVTMPPDGMIHIQKKEIASSTAINQKSPAKTAPTKITPVKITDPKTTAPIATTVKPKEEAKKKQEALPLFLTSGGMGEQNSGDKPEDKDDFNPPDDW